MTSQRDVLLFAALAIAWGTAYGAIEIGLETLPPLLFAALRFDVAALLFVAVVGVLGLEWRPTRWTDWAAIGAAGSFMIGGHFAFLFLGQSYVSSAVSAIVLSLTPIVTPPLALAVLPRERIRAPVVVGLGLGLGGIALIATAGGSLGGRAVGVALLFASAVSLALGSVLVERLEGTLPAMSFQTWAMVVGAGILHALSAVHPGESVAALAPEPSMIGALAYLGVVSTAGGFLAYFTLLERVGATEVSLVSYASPVVATLVGWALLGESITAATVVGFALIVAGFALCKIETLWRTVGPAVGYGPRRSTGDRDGVVVDGNVYVPDPSAERRTRGVASSAD